MEQKKKNRLIRVPYLLNASLFFLGGFSFIGENQVLLAIIQFVASSLNLVGLLFALHPRFGTRFKQSVLLVDVLVAASVGFNYVEQGKQYIQYVWFFAAIMSLVAMVIQARKSSTTQKELQE